MHQVVKKKTHLAPEFVFVTGLLDEFLDPLGISPSNSSFFTKSLLSSEVQARVSVSASGFESTVLLICATIWRREL